MADEDYEEYRTNLTDADQHAVDLLMRSGTPGFTIVDRTEQYKQCEELWAKIQQLFGRTIYVALTLLAGWAGGLAAQVTDSAAHAFSHYRGETRCTAGLATSTQHPTLSALDSTETIAHEAVHRRQLAVGCDSVLELWGRDLTAKMNAEAEALCVGMRAAGLSDVERKQRAVEAAKWWAQFNGRWSFAEYLAVFSLWCNP